MTASPGRILPQIFLRTSVALLAGAMFDICAGAFEGAAPSTPAAAFSAVPGIVINHSPAASGLYIGSPSIAVLTNGDYVASHDFFGPNSHEAERPSTWVFRSADQGQTWKSLARIQGAFWSSLFVQGGALYLIGPNRHHGAIHIRRSMDGGETWTVPTDSQNGVLRADADYHCAPVPVVTHGGRLWRAFERLDPPRKWGASYCAGMLSAPLEGDLLNAASWTASNFLPCDPSWNHGDMGGWLEGNAVVTREGELLDILRVETAALPEKAALVRVTPDGRRATFDPAIGFINFPGGAKKFTIRYDRKSDQYWALSTVVQKPLEQATPAKRPASIRNCLALISSPDLSHWTIRSQLLSHPDTATHGFQYADFLIEGDDLIAAVRTAFDDGEGGAHNFHDANFLTFHRWRDFRAQH